MHKKDLSIIIPCYNEGVKLLKNINKIQLYLQKKQINYEIIIVNDGSTDDTEKYCVKLQAENSDILYYTYDNNRGKGGAVKVGIENSTGDWIIFMDADLSTDLIAIENVILNKNDYDVIIGSRRHQYSTIVKPQNKTRKFVGNMCSLLTNIIIPLKISDTQCGFKAFEGEFAREMIKKQQLNGFAFDVEYLYIAKLNNKKIVEVNVKWENDEDSKVPVLKSSIMFFKDLFKIKKNKNFYKGE